MDLSIFPRGKYYAKQATISLKRSYPPSSGKPFALNINIPSKKADNHAMIWDLEAFRPDPREIVTQKATKATILYESVNYTSSDSCHKIPRYIVTSDGQWLVNVR